MSTLYAGIDVGGTSLKSLVVNDVGEIVETNAHSTANSTIAQLTSIASQLVSSHPDIAGIGIVVPGTVDEESGTVGYASNVDLSGVNIPAAVTTATSAPHSSAMTGAAPDSPKAFSGLLKGTSPAWSSPSGLVFRHRCASLEWCGRGTPINPGKLGTSRWTLKENPVPAVSVAVWRCTPRQKVLRDATRKPPVRQSEL